MSDLARECAAAAMSASGIACSPGASIAAEAAATATVYRSCYGITAIAALRGVVGEFDAAQRYVRCRMAVEIATRE
ncbi:hypothetical protein A7A08_03099 [Methyloligella halotolerans]|uniref:Uncharacterized protein n=1 Tax=Methyloligella halotolerans TaxID=1177755 RepID=A0A1E2RV32_9HYPH|nr:hypothetical protein A7A08_03099 [Methyloligella halotolerans]